jgi:hypothetical protein
MDFSALFRIALRDADPEIRATAIEGLMATRMCGGGTILQNLDRRRCHHAARESGAGFGAIHLLGELQKIRPRPFDMARHALHQAYHNPAEPLEVKRRALESWPTRPGWRGRHDRRSLRPLRDQNADQRGLCNGDAARTNAGRTSCAGIDQFWPEMRYEAARSCGELELREAVPDLLELLEDVDTEVQQVTLWALGQIGGDLARSALARYSRSEDEALSQAAREALDELEFFHATWEAFSVRHRVCRRERCRLGRRGAFGRRLGRPGRPARRRRRRR